MNNFITNLFDSGTIALAGILLGMYAVLNYKITKLEERIKKIENKEI
ncbi:MAG: hypothetical protein ACRCX2_23825 [Paraclostridium sp.]